MGLRKMKAILFTYSDCSEREKKRYSNFDPEIHKVLKQIVIDEKGTRIERR